METSLKRIDKTRQRGINTILDQIFKSKCDLQLEESKGTYFNHNFFINISQLKYSPFSVFVFCHTKLHFKTNNFSCLSYLRLYVEFAFFFTIIVVINICKYLKEITCRSVASWPFVGNTFVSLDFYCETYFSIQNVSRWLYDILY